MPGEVTPLFTVDGEGKPSRVVQSVDVAFVTTIGEGRQLSLRTMVDRDSSIAEQRSVVRNMLEIADIETAQYELRDLRWQLHLKAKGLKRVEEDVARLDRQNAGRAAQIQVEMDALVAEQTDRALGHERAFSASGRQGNFKRSQPQQAELGRITSDISKLKSELDGIATATGGERRDTLVALARIKQDIAQVEEEIEKRELFLKPVGA